MSRYPVETLDDYMHLVAMYRNARAIEAQKARTRHLELVELAKSIESARLAVLL